MDIALILQPEDATLRHSDFYTRYIPRQSEYRTWVYRRRILGTYQKVLAYPQRYHRIGANHRNGFVFKLVASEAVPAGLREIAAGAVDSLGLDFGAVDILLGVDGLLYVLECNTAPGVEGEDRQVIRALAAKMRRWIELEFPRRKGETR
jgi:glutathione synthase/RimK-type ligase-like ATP-grasp enzyme